MTEDYKGLCFTCAHNVRGGRSTIQTQHASSKIGLLRMNANCSCHASHAYVDRMWRRRRGFAGGNVTIVGVS